MFDQYVQSLMIFTGINIIAAFSFYLPFKTGQVSLGQAGFMAIGAYAAGIVTKKLGLPFPLGLAFAGLAAGVIGLGVGFPALRIKGIYLLLLTLGFAQIIQVVALTWDYTGAADGFQGLPYQAHTLYYVYAIIFVLMILFHRLERSSLGRAMAAVHSDEDAAELMGVDIVRIKLLAFSLGAAIAGFAGGLFAHITTYVDSTTFDILLAVQILMFVVVGGGATFWGPIVGATVLTLLPEFLRTIRGWMELIPESWTSDPPWSRIYESVYEFLDFENEKRWIAYGIILIIMMIVRPQGLLTRDALRLSFFRLRRKATTQ
jgi:branched-chain amino acid transport system permease protein